MDVSMIDDRMNKMIQELVEKFGRRMESGGKTPVEFFKTDNLDYTIIYKTVNSDQKEVKSSFADSVVQGSLQTSSSGAAGAPVKKSLVGKPQSKDILVDPGK